MTVWINGARGVVMFFSGVMALAFGLAFTGPWKVIPPPPRGLIVLDDWISLEIWGYGWYLAAACLIVGAFRQNQAWAMGIYAAMLFLWFGSYAWTLVAELVETGRSSMWYSTAIFGSFLGVVLGVARLVNAPPLPKMEKYPTGEIQVVKDDEVRLRESGDGV